MIFGGVTSYRGISLSSLHVDFKGGIDSFLGAWGHQGVKFTTSRLMLVGVTRFLRWEKWLAGTCEKGFTQRLALVKVVTIGVRGRYPPLLLKFAVVFILLPSRQDIDTTGQTNGGCFIISYFRYYYCCVGVFINPRAWQKCPAANSALIISQRTRKTMTWRESNPTPQAIMCALCSSPSPSITRQDTKNEVPSHARGISSATSSSSTLESCSKRNCGFLVLYTGPWCTEHKTISRLSVP